MVIEVPGIKDAHSMPCRRRKNEPTAIVLVLEGHWGVKIGVRVTFVTFNKSL